MLPFSSKALKQRKGQYGTQIIKSQSGVKLITLRDSSKYRFKQADQNVDRFIKNQITNINNTQLFRNILKQKIMEGKSQVYSYNFTQISDFIPWVFSPKYLFQPFRSLLYCAKTGIPLQQAWDIISNFDDQSINNIAMQAIYQSIKFQQPYVQIAINAFNEGYQGYYSKAYVIAKQFMINQIYYFQTIVDSVKNVGRKLGDNVVSKAAIDLTNWAGNKVVDFYRTFTQDKRFQQNQWKKVNVSDRQQLMSMRGLIHDVLKKLFGSLRVYGQVLINFDFLKIVGKKRMIDGKLYYFLPNQPDLFLNMQQSLPGVFKIKNNQFVKIPQKLFNIEFLRGMVLGDVISLGGGLFKRFRQQYNQTQQQVKGRSTFRKKYLAFGDEKIQKQTQSLIQRNLTWGDLAREIKNGVKTKTQTKTQNEIANEATQ